MWFWISGFESHFLGLSSRQLWKWFDSITDWDWNFPSANDSACCFFIKAVNFLIIFMNKCNLNIWVLLSSLLIHDLTSMRILKRNGSALRLRDTWSLCLCGYKDIFWRILGLCWQSLHWIVIFKQSLCF